MESILRKVATKHANIKPAAAEALLVVAMHKYDLGISGEQEYKMLVDGIKREGEDVTAQQERLLEDAVLSSLSELKGELATQVALRAQRINTSFKDAAAAAIVSSKSSFDEATMAARPPASQPEHIASLAAEAAAAATSEVQQQVTEEMQSDDLVVKQRVMAEVEALNLGEVAPGHT